MLSLIELVICRKRIKSLCPREQKKLVSDLESKIYLTTKEIIFYVKKEFGVVYTVGGITSLLHQMGFSYKKPKGVPGKAKAKDQKAFVKKYNRIKEKKGLIYFADSTHPVLSSGWIRKGKEYEVKTNSGRQRVKMIWFLQMLKVNL